MTRFSGKSSSSAPSILFILPHLLTSFRSDAVPDSEKSTGQSMMDKASREKDSHKDESLLDKAKSAVGLDKK